MAVKQDVKAVLYAKIDKHFSPIVLAKGQKAFAKKAHELQMERIGFGLDIYGRRFGHYTTTYAPFKKKFLSGGKGKSYLKLRARKTRFAATKVKDHLQLTGELFEDLRYKAVGTPKNRRGKIAFKIQLYIDKRSEEKAKGLMSTTGRNKHVSYSKKAWSFFGLSVSGARVRYEQKELKKAFAQAIQSNISGGRIIPNG